MFKPPLKQSSSKALQASFESALKTTLRTYDSLSCFYANESKKWATLIINKTFRSLKVLRIAKVKKKKKVREASFSLILAKDQPQLEYTGAALAVKTNKSVHILLNSPFSSSTFLFLDLAQDLSCKCIDPC